MSSPWDNVSRQYGVQPPGEPDEVSEAVAEDAPASEPRSGLLTFDEIMHSSGTEVAQAKARSEALL